MIFSTAFIFAKPFDGKNSDLLTTRFTNNKVGEPFIVLKQVASTNNYAMEQVKTGSAGHGAAWLALDQTGGKGQRNRAWVSETGKNILLSVILDANSWKTSELFKVSVAAALAAHDFFIKYVPDNISIKWPNDIYAGDRKAGGILIENIIRGNIWQFAIVGVGLNINQDVFDAALPNPVSLKQLTGKVHDVIEMAMELCNCLDYRYNQLITAGFGIMLQQYNAVLYKKEALVELRKGNVVSSHIIKGVNALGQLETGQQVFDFGEVEWLLR